jgi:uncharacterized protein
MILDLKKLKRSGKDQSDFFFEYAPNEEIITLPSVGFKEDVKITGTVYLTGDHSAVVEGEVVFVLKGECTRCLEDTEKEFIAEFSESVDADDAEGYPLKNDTIDLTKIVDDLVMMNIPVNFLCKEDCKGLCAGCGTNLNQSECKCKNKEGKE